MLIAILLSSALLAPPDTLELSLQAALDRARADNPTLRAEWAEARSARQDALEATQAFLPTVRAEVQGSRTTDPVGVFGLKLRQSEFGAEDLAIDGLNNPSPFTGFSSSLTVEMPIFVLDGLEGFRAARDAADARGAQASRAAGATAFMVTQAYWDARLASGRVEALDAALEAARSHEREAVALHEHGVVTGLDQRLARLRRAEIEVQLVGATAEAENALSNLRALLAVDESTPLRLTDPLVAPLADACAPTSACDVADRGDLRAFEAGAEAARAGYRSAWGAQLPKVVAFGGVTHHGAGSPWDSGSSDWALGLAVRWDLLPALGGVATVRRASARADAAQARLEAAQRSATAEAEAARRRLEAASQAVVIAADAEAEAEAATEQARQRYRTGVSTITELLDVQAAATHAALSHLSARRDLVVAQAAVEFAHGVFDR